MKTETKVNDLTSAVKKKKKPPVDVPSGSTKRKADDDPQEGDKKPKLSPS